jgi:YidC/Oxa1 family membrane protein insertase
MFNTFIFAPLYNLLVWLLSVVPGHYVWVAVALMTIIVKVVLVPLYKKQIKDQLVLAHISPKIKSLQEKYKEKTPENQQLMAKEVMDLYKDYKVNPLRTILILLIQLPVLFALYRIFLGGIDKHLDLLYSFVTKPEFVNANFFGIEMSARSLLLALVAGVTMFILNKFMFMHKDKNTEETDFQKSLNLQMQYVLPIVIGSVSYFTPAVIAIYIIVGNLFGIFQEYFIRRPFEKEIKQELALK